VCVCIYIYCEIFTSFHACTHTYTHTGACTARTHTVKYRNLKEGLFCRTPIHTYTQIYRGMHRAHTCGKGRNLEEGLFSLPGKLGKPGKKNMNVSMKDMSPCIGMHLELLGRSSLTPFTDTNGDTWFLYRTGEDMSAFEKALDGRSALDMKILARVKALRKKDGGKSSTEESQGAAVVDTNMSSSEGDYDRDKTGSGVPADWRAHACSQVSSEPPASGASNNAYGGGGSSAAEDAANFDEDARKEDEDEKRKEKKEAAPKKRARSYVDEMMEDQPAIVPRLRELFDDLLLKLTHVPVSNRLRALLDLNTAMPGEGLAVARADGKSGDADGKSGDADGKGGDAALAKKDKEKDASKRAKKTSGAEEERPLWTGGGNKVCLSAFGCTHRFVTFIDTCMRHVDFE
jgi:hypothetical protein